MPLSSGHRATIRAARPGDVPAVAEFLAPFVARGTLLARSEEELARLVRHAVLAEGKSRIVGFAALEIYSRKLSEIQCLAVDARARVAGIGWQLVRWCVDLARERGVLEVMAVVSPSVEKPLKQCGFHIALPGQKRAMFTRLADKLSARDKLSACDKLPSGGKRSSAAAQRLPIRHATRHDLPAVVEFLKPFVARGEVLPRTSDELAHLLKHGFVAEAQGRIAGFAALEIYSRKLAEVQCLSVDEQFRGHGLGRRLVHCCVERSRQHEVAETMAITSSEHFMQRCGFHVSLPGQKIALFLRTRDP